MFVCGKENEERDSQAGYNVGNADNLYMTWRILSKLSVTFKAAINFQSSKNFSTKIISTI